MGFEDFTVGLENIYKNLDLEKLQVTGARPVLKQNCPKLARLRNTKKMFQ
jgi:hypothetical protein